MYLLKSDGSKTLVTPANGKRLTLEEMQKHVGGYIQILDLWVPQTNGGKVRVRMVIDEEGKLKGYPRNDAATRMIGAALMPGDYIVGTAIIPEKGDKL